MKKNVFILNIIGIFFILVACGDAEKKTEESDKKQKDAEKHEVVIYNPESDAVDLAEIICVIERLHIELMLAEEPEKIMEKIIELGKTADELNLKIEEKYVDDEEALERFREILINYEC